MARKISKRRSEQNARALAMLCGDELPVTRQQRQRRHTMRTPELDKKLLEWLSGGNTLAEFCRQPGHPSRETVHIWRHKDPEFMRLYGEARDRGYDTIAESCLQIADDTSGDTESDAVARSKLRVETRLKLLAKWDPRRYGDRTELGVSGGVSLVVATNVPRAPQQQLPLLEE
jgi:hypothetical protein